MPNPAVFSNYYEAPGRGSDEIGCYCDRLCYSPGDRLRLQVSTTAARYDLEIARDGLDLDVVYTRRGLAGKWHDTPADASVSGCGWPCAFELEIPRGWPSGGYRVTCGIIAADGSPRRQHFLFLLRSTAAGRDQRLALVAAVGTWCAYNNWGGSNHYEGITGPDADAFAPLLSRFLGA